MANNLYHYLVRHSLLSFCCSNFLQNFPKNKVKTEQNEKFFGSVKWCKKRNLGAISIILCNVCDVQYSLSLPCFFRT